MTRSGEKKGSYIYYLDRIYYYYYLFFLDYLRMQSFSKTLCDVWRGSQRHIKNKICNI